MNRMKMVRDQERWPLPKLIYAILMGILFISYLVVQAFDHDPFVLPTILVLPMTVAAVLGIWLGRLWRDKGFLLMVVLLALQTIRVAAKGGYLLFSEAVSESLFNGLWAVAGCYALGRILSAKQLKSFLWIIVTIWIIGTVIQCLIALYAAWTDHEILNLSGGSVWGMLPHSVWEEYVVERLLVGYVHPTVTGSTLSISGVLTFGALLTAPRKRDKILLGLAYLVIIVTLGLTDARTSFLSLSAGIGVTVFSAVLWLIRSCRKRKIWGGESKGKEVINWLIASACMIVAFTVSVIAIMKVAPVFNDVKTSGGVVITSASAEEEGEWRHKVRSRGFEKSDVLSGRDVIWNGVIRYCAEDPKRLLFGESIVDPMFGPNTRFESDMAHSHNMFIQVLLESGLSGLILVISFVISMALKGFRIISSKSAALWIRLVPALPVSVLVGDLAECFGWFRQWKIPALAFMFVAFGIINAYGDRKINHQEEYLA